MTIPTCVEQPDTVTNEHPSGAKQPSTAGAMSPMELSIGTYQQYMFYFANTPGWFYGQSAAIWDTLLSYQEATNNDGNLLEIGVFQGKSAGMAALHRRGNETCVFVDPMPLDHVESRIKEVIPSAKCQYLQEFSQFLPRHPFVRDAARDFRWIHIDGEHSAQAVCNDLAIAEMLLSDRGILVLDDFFSPSYPQITQALFRFLEATPNRLTLVLCGYNKGYLCRPRAAREYLTFMQNSLYPNLARRNCSNVTICKTSDPADMNTFGIIDRYKDMDYRGPDWDLENISI